MGFDCVPPHKLDQLTEISRYVSELANLSPEGHQPFVGQSAFAHKGGTHVNAVVKNVMSYQHIEPGLVGNETRVLLSELSGKDNIAVKRKEFGLNGLSLAEEREVLQQIKELENAGFAFESAEASVDLMLRRVRPGYVSPFEMIDYTAAVEYRRGRGMFSEGDSQGAGGGSGVPRGGRGQRPGQRPQPGLAQGPGQILSPAAGCASHRL